MHSQKITTDFRHKTSMAFMIRSIENKQNRSELILDVSDAIVFVQAQYKYDKDRYVSLSILH